MATSGITWLVGQITPAAAATTDATIAAAHTVTQAGNSTVWVGAGAILTIIVNGWLADRKSSRESEERVAQSEARVATKVAEALRLADQKADAKADRLRDEVAELRGRRDAEREIAEKQLREAMAEIAMLRGHVEIAATSIDANADAIRTLADVAMVSVPTLPRMNGGSGLMNAPRVSP
jgi:hypothetical protein